MEAREEQRVCGLKRGHGSKKALKKGKDDEGIRGRVTPWGTMSKNGWLDERWEGGS